MVARRGFLAGGAMAAAALAAGCGDDGRPRDPLSEGQLVTSVKGDVELLTTAYGMELRLAAGYAELAGRLRGFAAHEEEHAERLRAAIDRLGGASPREAQIRLGDRRGDRALRQLLDLEAEQVAFYVDALPKLYEPGLRRLASSILAVGAEHMAVLRSELGDDPAPDAFVYGWVREA